MNEFSREFQSILKDAESLILIALLLEARIILLQLVAKTLYPATNTFLSNH